MENPIKMDDKWGTRFIWKHWKPSNVSNVGWGDYRLVPDARFCPKCGRLRSRLEAQTMKIGVVIWISLNFHEPCVCRLFNGLQATKVRIRNWPVVAMVRKSLHNERARLVWSCLVQRFDSVFFLFSSWRLDRTHFPLGAWWLGWWGRFGKGGDRTKRDESVVSKELVKHWPPNNFWRRKRWTLSGRHQRWTLLVANSSTFCLGLCRSWLFALCQSSWVHRCWTKAGSISLIPLASGQVHHVHPDECPVSAEPRQVPTGLHHRGQDSMVGRSDRDRKMQGQWLLQRRALNNLKYKSWIYQP